MCLCIIINKNLLGNIIKSEDLAALLEEIADPEKQIEIGTSLDLQHQQIRAEQAVLLAKALISNYTITSLDLSSNPIGDTGVLALAETMLVNPTIIKLNLNDTSGYAGGGLKALAKTNLVELHLSGTGIGDKEIADLAENDSITTLNIGLNYFTIKAGLILTSKNTRLRSLAIDVQNVDDARLEVLVGFAENKFITELSYQESSMYPIILEKIGANKSITRIYFTDNHGRAYHPELDKFYRNYFFNFNTERWKYHVAATLYRFQDLEAGRDHEFDDNPDAYQSDNEPFDYDEFQNCPALADLLLKLNHYAITEAINMQRPSGDTPLHEACRTNNIAAIAVLTACYGIDLHIRNIHNETPLHVAAKHGNIDIVNAMLTCVKSENYAAEDLTISWANQHLRFSECARAIIHFYGMCLATATIPDFEQKIITTIVMSYASDYIKDRNNDYRQQQNTSFHRLQRDFSAQLNRVAGPVPAEITDSSAQSAVVASSGTSNAATNSSACLPPLHALIRHINRLSENERHKRPAEASAAANTSAAGAATSNEQAHNTAESPTAISAKRGKVALSV